ncbi:MAG: flagellar basal body P-ring protein FlgI [Methylococcales bacterium]|nr:flagellar basal body P-ring protein FlgI [Methylococcales bacterium]
MKRVWGGLMVALLIYGSLASAERIKDLSSIDGVRSNQLVGYGVVVGLNKSGDKTKFTGQSMRSMLARLGIVLPAGIDPKSKNIAAVALHASLPAFAKLGQTIDVTVSSIGDAKSLRGGSLLMSPLKGADGNIYAIAQGSLVVTGLNASGRDGSKITVNNPAVGRIPNGATVERKVDSPFDKGSSLTFNLHQSDFTTAHRMVEAINEKFGANTAEALDAASVKVSVPLNRSQRVSFVSILENMDIIPDDSPARVIINARSGTVVINGNVRVQPTAVSHGSLTVTVSETLQTSQPNIFAEGETVVTPQSEVLIDEGSGGLNASGNHMFVFQPGVSLDQIVEAVNKVGAGPMDLIAILEALKSSGALRAELIVI